MEVSTRRSPVEERPVLVRAALAQTPSIWWLIISILWKVWKAKHFKMKTYMHIVHNARSVESISKWKATCTLHSAHDAKSVESTPKWKATVHTIVCHRPANGDWCSRSASPPCHAMLLLHRLGCENLFPFIFLYPILEETINEQGYKQTRIKRHLAWEKVVVQWAPGWKNWEKRALSRRSAPIKTITRAL